MLSALPWKSIMPFSLLLIGLMLYGCGRSSAGMDDPPHQNVIVLLDLSDRIVKTRDQMERDIYLVNTIYQTFGHRLIDALDEGREEAACNRFRVVLPAPDAAGRYQDLLPRLQVNPSELSTDALRQRFSEEGTIDFSTTLYRLYERATKTAPRSRPDAIARFFNESLPTHLSEAPGTANQLFLITDGRKPAPAFEAAAPYFSSPLPELNVLLLEANPGEGIEKWQRMRVEWDEQLRRLGVRSVNLEKRQTGILALRDQIQQLMAGGELSPLPTDLTAPAQEPLRPAVEETTGRIIAKAKFWLGRPDEEGAMALLHIDPDTKVDLLEPTGAYYKVKHRELIGFVKRDCITVLEPEADSPAAGAPAPASAASPQRRPPEAEPAVAQAVAVTPCTGALGDELLPGVSCAQYKAKVLKKVADLEQYLKTVVDKAARNREKSIDLACRLFVNEQAVVYTSNMEGARRGRPIRRYLEGLMYLNYDHVEVEWTNIQYVSGLRKGPDGRFFGTVQIEQRFEGYLDGRLVYGDVTEKNITVVLEAYEVVDPQGNANTRWDVFLSDIGVEQTKIQG